MLKISFYALLVAGLCSAALSTKQPTPPCGIYGMVKDKNNGSAVAFATLALYRHDTLLYTTSAGSDGSYCFKNPGAGKYRIRVNYVGYITRDLKNIAYSGKTPLRTDLELSADQKNKLEEVAIRTEKKAMGMVHRDMEYDLYSKSAAPSGDYYAPPAATSEFNTENYTKIDDNEFKATEKNPLSTFSIDVDKASYSNVRRFLQQGQRPPADAVRVEELINYFAYHYNQPKGDAPFSITTQYLSCPWNNGHSLIHIGIQGKEIKTENMPANNLVFLIDVSGSMEDANKLPLLKAGLRLLVDQMRPQDKIAIVVYAGAAGVVLPPTSGEQKEQLLDALDNLQAGGSTAGGAGIVLAYKIAKDHFLNEGNNRVILATDGDFNVGISSDGDLVRLIEQQREQGVFLTVLGFGTGNYKDSKMEQLADKGNGNYAYIDNLLEAKKTLVKEMGGTLLTIAKDVKIQVEFNPAKVKAYRLVGYENRLLNNEDFNNDKKDAGELGSGHTVTAIYEIIPAGGEALTASVDSLKYQTTVRNPGLNTNEVMTIKFRYKAPTGTESKLITHVVADKKLELTTASENARFSAAVAEFGMLLRDSKFKGNSSFTSILAMARAAKGKDDDGYRAEFIRLVEMAELLK